MHQNVEPPKVEVKVKVERNDMNSSKNNYEKEDDL